APRARLCGKNGTLTRNAAAVHAPPKVVAREIEILKADQIAEVLAQFEGSTRLGPPNPSQVAYALFGTSRQLVVGPDTATGLISALTVGAVAVQGTPEYNALTSTLARFLKG